MTIKEFADLCLCNPQTLRYYDRENLLKPVRVDEQSGYRFYDEQQAITFVKIRNLQKAGFTIDEIKELLTKSDAEIYEAFEEIINEQKKRIIEIRKIQRTYQTELFDMMKKIEEFRDIVKESMVSYDPYEEFGIGDKEYEIMTQEIELLLDEIIADGNMSHFEFDDYSETDEEDEKIYFESCISNTENEVIYECHKWEYVKEFFENIPKMNEIDGYLLLFKVNSEKSNKTAFANAVIGLSLLQNGRRLKIGCTVIDSEDEYNHFWLVKYSV